MTRSGCSSEYDSHEYRWPWTVLWVCCPCALIPGKHQLQQLTWPGKHLVSKPPNHVGTLYLLHRWRGWLYLQNHIRNILRCINRDEWKYFKWLCMFISIYTTLSWAMADCRLGILLASLRSSEFIFPFFIFRWTWKIKEIATKSGSDSTQFNSRDMCRYWGYLRKE